MRKYLEAYDFSNLDHFEFETARDVKQYRNDMINGFGRLLSLEDRYKDSPALVMGLGPSLLDIDKKKYQNHLKIVCNNFHKVDNFFDDSFKPNFSYDALREPFSVCLERNINIIISIPIKKEFENILEISKNKGFKDNLISTWLWGDKLFQNVLSQKYSTQSKYSHCNTITNHMIGYALWMGCNPINIVGFDLSYSKSLNKIGYTHAGFSDATNKQKENDPFQDPSQRSQIINDLKYLCSIAKKNNIKINNLSYKLNGLPYKLSY